MQRWVSEKKEHLEVRIDEVIQTIDVSASASGIRVVTRKPSASVHAVKKARHVTGIRRGSGARRAAGIAARLAKSGYRSDLRKVSISINIIVEYILCPLFSFLVSLYFVFQKKTHSRQNPLDPPKGE